MITITRDGYIKRVSMRSYNASSESMTQRKDTDSLVCYGASHTLQTLVFFTNRGTYDIFRFTRLKRQNGKIWVAISQIILRWIQVKKSLRPMY